MANEQNKQVFLLERCDRQPRELRGLEEMLASAPYKCDSQPGLFVSEACYSSKH